MLKKKRKTPKEVLQIALKRGEKELEVKDTCCGQASQRDTAKGGRVAGEGRGIKEKGGRACQNC